MKQDVNKDIVQFKARWIVKNYLQQYGLNFNQMFIIMVKPMVFYILFAIIANYNLDIDQINVKTTFLYSLINQLIYTEMPKDTKTNTTII